MLLPPSNRPKAISPDGPKLMPKKPNMVSSHGPGSDAPRSVLPKKPLKTVSSHGPGSGAPRSVPPARPKAITPPGPGNLPPMSVTPPGPPLMPPAPVDGGRPISIAGDRGESMMPPLEAMPFDPGMAGSFGGLQNAAGFIDEEMPMKRVPLSLKVMRGY